MTGALDAAQTEEGLKDALNDLKRKFATTRSIARQQAGMPEEEAPKRRRREPLSDENSQETMEALIDWRRSYTRDQLRRRYGSRAAGDNDVGRMISGPIQSLGSTPAQSEEAAA